MKEIYTIGYTAFKLHDFLDVLTTNMISTIIDVRSVPVASKFYSDFSMPELERSLKARGILYRNYAKEFGARQQERIYYNESGYLDFSLFSQSPQFKQGIDKILKGLDMGYTFGLLCAEKDPINCHRTILVAREFHKLGIQIRNIMSTGDIELQEDIEKRLIEKYFPERHQISIFTEVVEDKYLVDQAYAKRNAEIGFQIEEEK